MLQPILMKRRPRPRSACGIDPGETNMFITRIETDDPKDVRPSEPLPEGSYRSTHREGIDLGSGNKLADYSKKVVAALEEMPWAMESERIRIEQQPYYPGKKAYNCMRNQTWSMIVYTYFVTKGHQDVGFTHASHKLNVLGPAWKGKGAPSGEANYTKRKKLGVPMAIQAFAHQPEVVEELQDSEKADDEADDLLMTLHALFREK